jgi:transcriptional antiterminator NusG
MSREWYILHTASSCENRVKANLENLIRSGQYTGVILQVRVPQEEVVEMKKGRKRSSQRRLYPGYVLVEMDLPDGDHVWKEPCAAARALPGVTGWVGVGADRKPKPITREEAREILERIGEIKAAAGTRRKEDYSVGQMVKVVDGPFSGFNGTVEEVFPDKGRLKVKIQIFGRSTPVELDFLQVKKL